MARTKPRSLRNMRFELDNSDLDETVPLPAISVYPGISRQAANDQAFAGETVEDAIEQLLVLAKSNDERLDKLEEAVAEAREQSRPKRTAKKVTTGKRATNKKAAR